MNSLIAESLSQGKYVTIDDRIGYGISTSEKHESIFFDASICKEVITWKESSCDVDIKGDIHFIIFPEGYMPELSYDGVVFKYHHNYNNDPTTSMLVIADTENLYTSYKWYCDHINDKLPSTVVRSVHKWDPRNEYWKNKGVYRDTNLGTIVGMESIFDAVMKDIKIIQEKKEILDILGMSPSANYLLVSRPGMGKTSLIRAVCTALNVGMHIIDVDAMMSSNPEEIFQKTTNSNKISVYLFEDFDRYLDTAKDEQMAGLLNALDGVETMPSSIRFFTANSHISGEKMEAFLSRMRRNITLPSHNLDAYLRSIRTVFPSLNQEEQDQIAHLFSVKDITMRVANQILCAAMIYDEPMNYILTAISDSSRTQPIKIIEKVDVEEDEYESSYDE